MIKQEISEQHQKLIRSTFSILFLAYLASQMFDIKQVDLLKQYYIDKGSDFNCVRDITFEWTQVINDFLSQNRNLKKGMNIWISTLMDIMILSYMGIFYKHFKSYRVVCAYILFFGTRAVLQNNFYMPRLSGFLFEWPGWYSLTVPYHDTNDFFYSGHVGTCYLLYREYRTMKWNKMAVFCMFTLLNQWVFLLLIRNHYIIDLITGVIFANYMYNWAEKISWICDTFILGLRNFQKGRHNLKPCDQCGWSNKFYKDYMIEKEIYQKLVDKHQSLQVNEDTTNTTDIDQEEYYKPQQHKSQKQNESFSINF